MQRDWLIAHLQEDIPQQIYQQNFCEEMRLYLDELLHNQWTGQGGRMEWLPEGTFLGGGSVVMDSGYVSGFGPHQYSSRQRPVQN
jgi:hypothetical protein